MTTCDPYFLLIGLLAVATSASAQEVAASERAVLVDLFKSAGGSQWERNRNWNSGVSVCYWEGVSCTYIDFDEKRAWSAQQLSLALLAEAYWEKSSAKPKCDFQR